MLKLLQRILDTIVSLVAIVLSLGFQAIFFLLLTWGVIGLLEVCGIKIKGELACWLIAGGLIVTFNAIAFYEYFVKRRMASITRSGVHALEGAVGGDSAHAAGILFMIPRAVDTIIRGRDLTTDQQRK